MDEEMKQGGGKNMKWDLDINFGATRNSVKERGKQKSLWKQSINGEGYAREKRDSGNCVKEVKRGRRKKGRVGNVKAKNDIRSHTNKTQSGESIKREEWRMYFKRECN